MENQPVDKQAFDRQLKERRAPLTYATTGVNYEAMDPLKRMAQLKARETAKNLETAGYREIEASRGESAYVWEEPTKYGAFVIEGLGTKNKVADAMRKITGRTYHDQIAQDDVAMIVNDLITVGARPLVVDAYFAAGSDTWFNDTQRMEDLTDGFRDACNLAGAVWGGGESPTLKGIILEEEFTLADRSHMTYRILLGQNILKKGNFLIDPLKKIGTK